MKGYKEEKNGGGDAGSRLREGVSFHEKSTSSLKDRGMGTTDGAQKPVGPAKGSVKTEKGTFHCR